MLQGCSAYTDESGGASSFLRFRFMVRSICVFFFFFFQAEDGIRDVAVTGVQTCALPIYRLSEKLARGVRFRRLEESCIGLAAREGPCRFWGDRKSVV